jgi:hypothetical protein
MVKINASIVMRTLMPVPDVAEQRRMLTAAERIQGRVRREREVVGSLLVTKQGLAGDLLSGV